MTDANATITSLRIPVLDAAGVQEQLARAARGDVLQLHLIGPSARIDDDPGAWTHLAAVHGDDLDKTTVFRTLKYGDWVAP